MVSTRGHPKEFPEPDLSPSKATSTGTVGRPRKVKWAHTPANLVIIWLFISLPLVAWDTSYVFLRPYSMPGGSLHWPLWKPYDLYGTVDHIYGFVAYHEKNGFTAAQSFMNVVETLLYVYYMYILIVHGRPSKALGRGAPKKDTTGFVGLLSQQRYVDGRQGALAVVIGYSAAVMTVSKTALYWMNEYYSGFRHIGHNDPLSLIFLWIIPNGAWLVLPSYIIYVTGSEIIQGLTIAAGGAAPSPSDDTSPLKKEL